MENQFRTLSVQDKVVQVLQRDAYGTRLWLVVIGYVVIATGGILGVEVVAPLRKEQDGLVALAHLGADGLYGLLHGRRLALAGIGVQAEVGTFVDSLACHGGQDRAQKCQKE